MYECLKIPTSAKSIIISYVVMYVCSAVDKSSNTFPFYTLLELPPMVLSLLYSTYTYTTPTRHAAARPTCSVAVRAIHRFVLSLMLLYTVSVSVSVSCFEYSVVRVC